MPRNLRAKKPWVVMSLIALMVGFSGGYQLTRVDLAARADQTLEEALEYYADNSAAEPNERLRLIADSSRLAQIERGHHGDASSFRRMPERLRERTQVRFDTLIDRAYAAHHEANPGWRYGLTGRGDKFLNFLSHVVHTDSNRALAASILLLLITGLALEGRMGSVFFAGFCAMSAILTASVFVTLHEDLGVPWSGPAGIVAACVGLYLVTVRDGPIPGPIVLVLWVFAEGFVVRDGWNSGLASLPLWAEGAGLAFGIGLGVALPALQNSLTTEDEESPEERIDGILGEAMRLKSDGNAVDALRLLEEEVRKTPGEADLVRGFWDLAVSLHDAERAAPYMVAQLRACVRGGDVVRGVALWLALLEEVQNFKLETQVLVRLGEALLDEGHPGEAMDAMRRSLASTPPLSSSLAMRVVKVARDLDPKIAGRAAAIALRDQHLDPNLVPELEFLVSEVATSTYVDEPSLERPRTKAPAPTSSAGAGEADTHSLFDTSLSADLSDETDWSEVERRYGTDPASESASDNRLEERFNAGIPDNFLEDLDPNAIAPDALGQVDPAKAATDPFSEDTEAQMVEQATLDEERSSIGEPSLSELDPNALSLSDFDASPGELEIDEAPGELEIDEAPGELEIDEAPGDTAPEVPGESMLEVPGDTAPEVPVVGVSGRGLGTDTTESTETVPPEELAQHESAIGGATPIRSRILKVVSAQPLGIVETGLSLEIEDRGKSLVTFDRVEALAVAAVAGLSAKPVIVVDVVLNWTDLDEELRVIRLRSDTFSPLKLVEGETSPLKAIQIFLARILENSQAVPLPGEEAVRGPHFASFPDLVSYHRQVLSIAD